MAKTWTGRRVTPAMKDAAVAAFRLLRAGDPVARPGLLDSQVAARFAVSRSAVRRWVMLAGVDRDPCRRVGATQADRAARRERLRSIDEHARL